MLKIPFSKMYELERRTKKPRKIVRIFFDSCTMHFINNVGLLLWKKNISQKWFYFKWNDGKWKFGRHFLLFYSGSVACNTIKNKHGAKHLFLYLRSLQNIFPDKSFTFFAIKTQLSITGFDFDIFFSRRFSVWQQKISPRKKGAKVINQLVFN